MTYPTWWNSTKPWIFGNSMDVLKEMPSESVDCVVTSPPYWMLRDYQSEHVIWGGGPNCEHKWAINVKKPNGGQGSKSASVGANKNDSANMRDHDVITNKCLKCGAWKGELGLEPHFNDYISHLCDIFDEVKRVLKPTGTVWVVIGDSYSTHASGSKNHAHNFQSAEVASEHGIGTVKKPKTLPEKCLVQIPSRFAIEMVNRGWILRNEINWFKRSCMPSSIKDRFTIDFEKVYFFVKEPRYYFEQQFEPLSSVTMKGTDGIYAVGRDRPREDYINPLGRNKRTTWEVNPKPYSGAHFSTFPPDLIETPIKAGCPKYVCSKCGAPKYPIFESNNPSKEFMEWDDNRKSGAEGSYQSRQSIKSLHRQDGGVYSTVEFKGYEPSCDCGVEFVPGVVLDPFAGVGTTIMVAEGQGKIGLGIEINPKNEELMHDRVYGGDLPYGFEKEGSLDDLW